MDQETTDLGGPCGNGLSEIGRQAQSDEFLGVHLLDHEAGRQTCVAITLEKAISI